MNKYRIYQQVPKDLVDRCWENGHATVRWYAENPERAAMAGPWGAERDPKRQAQGRVGECASAMYFGVSVETLNWEVGPDKYDFIVPTSKKRADVKTTYPHYKLITSRMLNRFYDRKQFDVLISVSIEEHNFENCWIEGWCSKQWFKEHKQISDGINSNLAVGTWFVDKELLARIERLREPHYDAEGNFIHYCGACGRDAGLGFGVSLRQGKLGTWYCAKHAPRPPGPPSTDPADALAG